LLLFIHALITQTVRHLPVVLEGTDEPTDRVELFFGCILGRISSAKRDPLLKKSDGFLPDLIGKSVEFVFCDFPQLRDQNRGRAAGHADRHISGIDNKEFENGTVAIGALEIEPLTSQTHADRLSGVGLAEASDELRSTLDPRAGISTAFRSAELAASFISRSILSARRSSTCAAIARGGGWPSLQRER
jgi:hypothetical protein